MVDKIIPDDLRNVQSDKKTNDYFLIPLNDLNPGETYNMQFAWVYPDKTNSEWSSTFSVKAAEEMLDVTPSFISADLDGGKGFISINWRGRGIDDKILVGIKQVNIWIAGGQYGNNYVKIADFFNSASTKKIYVTPGRYYVKLQAVSYSGLVSNFSAIQNVFSLKSPLAATNVSGTWIAPDGSTKSDTLKVSFTFDPNFEDLTISGKDADSFKITLTAYGTKRSFLIPVDKSTTSQKFYLSASQNTSNFGLFATSFTIGITTIVTGLSESVLVEETSLTYVTPLDVPTITLTPGTLLYTVTWNSQTGKPFDQIYIEEIESNATSSPSTGWVQVAQGIQNPLTVQTLNSNKRWVRAKFYDSHGVSTSYSAASDVTPYAAVTADIEGPSNVTSVTTTAGIDTSGYLGFNGYIDVEWPSVTGGGIRGYRIRFSNDGGTTYSYVDSPGSGTKYRLGGLAIGSTYKIAVATYDEFNNTSTSYVSATDRIIPGTPSMSNYISAGNMKLGYGVDTSSDKGLYLDSSNYWYLNATNSARLNIGGSTSNYLNWNGAEFAIDGNLIAQKGTFKGNVSIASGGSLYSGTIVSGEISGAGYILNTSGLAFYQNSTEKTVINGSTGKLTTVSANIGGWDVDSTTINKNGIYLSSATRPSIITNAGAYYVGITTPVTANPQATDIVLWAGQSATGGTYLSGANFRVTAGGTLYASGAVITGGDVTFAPNSTTAIYLDLIDTKSTEAKETATEAQAALASKLEKTGGLIETNNQGQIMRFLSNGLNIYSGLFKILQPGESPVISGPHMIINSAGILGNNGSKNTFVIGTDGNATFRGTIEASTITGSLFQSQSYGLASKAGIAITGDGGTGESILFNYGGTAVGDITMVPSGINFRGTSNNNRVTINNTENRLDIRGGSYVRIEANDTTGIFYASANEGQMTFTKDFSLNSGIGGMGLYSTGTSYFTSLSGVSVSGSTATITAVSGIASINAFTSLRVTISGNLGLHVKEDEATLTGASNSLRVANSIATLTQSHASSVKGLRNISFTQTASTPSTGDPGDIVLVYV